MYCLFFFQRGEKLEDLNLLFINIHHLINELRPHQVCNDYFFNLTCKIFFIIIIIDTDEISGFFLYWPLVEMNFIFECWKYLSLIRFAHSCEILSALEDKIRIPTRPCNILYLSTLDKSLKQIWGGERLIHEKEVHCILLRFVIY